MNWFDCELCITKDVLRKATEEDTPFLFNTFIGGILIEALGINGSFVFFRKSKDSNNYIICWDLTDSGEEYAEVFSESELMEVLKNKYVEFDWKVVRK